MGLPVSGALPRQEDALIGGFRLEIDRRAEQAIAGIASEVVVGVGLIGVGDQGAVVDVVREAVAVGVRALFVDFAIAVVVLAVAELKVGQSLQRSFGLVGFHEGIFRFDLLGRRRHQPTIDFITASGSSGRTGGRVGIVHVRWRIANRADAIRISQQTTLPPSAR